MLALSLLAWQRSPGSQPRVSWRQGLASMHDWRRGKAGPMGSRHGKCSFVRIIRMRGSSPACVCVCVCVWTWLPTACWALISTPRLASASVHHGRAGRVHCSYAGRGRLAAGGWHMATGDAWPGSWQRRTTHIAGASTATTSSPYLPCVCVCASMYTNKYIRLAVRVSVCSTPQKTVPSNCPCAHAHDADDIHAAAAHPSVAISRPPALCKSSPSTTRIGLLFDH